MELTIQDINSKIYEIRNTKIMVDRDLAQFYGVETRRLKEQVKRNIERFPEDFMFQLTEKEVEFMVSQNAIPSKQHLGGSLPFAFTEQGVSMLSAVLKSKIAIDISIQIMRTFVAIKKYALTHDELAKKIEELENRVEKGEQVDKQILEVLSQLITDDKKEETKKMGFIH
jgi:hypothetical protein